MLPLRFDPLRMLVIVFGCCLVSHTVRAQVTPPPSTYPNTQFRSAPNLRPNTAQAITTSPVTTPPSMQQSIARPAAAVGGGQLPRDHNQEYRQYDLSRYTSNLAKVDKPQRAVVDWVLRETGTDVWFSEPFGFLNTNRDALTVYHTPEMQEVVKKTVDRFVNGPTDSQLMRLRLLTVSSPNWRARALPLIQDVSVQSPGVQAWLVTKENAAVLLSMLRARTDTHETHDKEIAIHNGQTESFSKVKGRTYVRTIRQSTNVWPPYEPEIGEVQEGYQLEVSPLLDTDGKTIECVIRAHIDQVDKLVPVDIELPLANGQSHRTRIEVPQIVGWRLHERFRWDSNMVLLLSCGVIASPDRDQSALSMLNLDRLVGNTKGRADALLFIEFKGRASEGLAPASRTAARPGDISRGRY